jgi:hypothetical protein
VTTKNISGVAHLWVGPNLPWLSIAVVVETRGVTKHPEIYPQRRLIRPKKATVLRLKTLALVN